MDTIDTSGKALLEFWDWAGDKGQMNGNTARALRAACSQVLAVEENWKSVDVRKLDVADSCRRFQNLRSKDFTPGSLETYKRRFATAVELFLDHAKDPAAWRPPSHSRTPKSDGLHPSGSARKANKPEQVEVSLGEDGLVDFPFPLRKGSVAVLRLPVDLKLADVKRLNAYLTTLASDFDPAGTLS